MGLASHAIMATPSASVAFDPLSLSPGIWLDPSDAATVTLNGATVAQINDKSTNSRHFTQGTAGAQPTYATGGSGINSLGCLSFDGGDTLNGPSYTLAQPYTLAIVIKFGTTGAQQAIFNNTTLWISGGFFGLWAGATLAGPAADTALHTMVAVYNGGSSSFRIDGSATTGTGGGTGASGTWELSRAVAPLLTGSKVGEVIVYPSALSAGDLTALEGYLKAKWGTP